MHPAKLSNGSGRKQKVDIFQHARCGCGQAAVHGQLVSRILMLILALLLLSFRFVENQTD